MDTLELKRRIAEGIEVRRRRGELVEPGKGSRPDPQGAHFTKKQRKAHTALITMAIASLAAREFDDWFETILALRTLMREANFSVDVYLHTCKSIEHAAVEAAQDKNLYAHAQLYLHKRRNVIINLPGMKPGTSDRGAKQHDPLREIIDKSAARQGTKRRPSD